MKIAILEKARENSRIIRGVLDSVEGYRGSKNFLKRSAVLLKDTLWRAFFYSDPQRPTIKWNLLWGSYSWDKDGDEWDNQAAFCNQPYEKWKSSIAETFIKPYISKDSVVLEIASGHGRWTKFMLGAKELILVELNKECIEYCKKRFSKYKNIKYFVNDGKKLNFIADSSVDFIFSYDSFVHMEKNVIDSYFREFSRILKPRGKAIIHHAGRGKTGRNRSDVSERAIKKLAERNGLKVIFQTDTWGKNKEFNCKACGDCISGLIRR